MKTSGMETGALEPLINMAMAGALFGLIRKKNRRLYNKAKALNSLLYFSTCNVDVNAL